MKKKNWIIRIAMIAIVLSVATACLVSGTFAKYTTTVSGGDSARVAKWVFGVTDGTTAYGVSETAAIDLFSTSNLGANLLSGQDLIAPEAEGDFDIIITMTGSEVAIELTSDVTVTNENNINVMFFIGAEKPEDDLGYTIDSTDFAVALEAAITDDIAQDALMVKEVKVWWKWVSSDVQDTALGEIGTATIAIDIVITATQKVSTII